MSSTHSIQASTLQRTSVTFVTLCAAALGAFGCATILGIEDAECDTASFETCRGADDTTGPGNGDGDGDGDNTADAGPPTQEEVCTEYCGAILENCEGDNVQFPGNLLCMATCMTLPLGSPGDEEGNSVHCRLGRAKSAGEFEPEVNCQVGGPSGGGICGDICDSYCATMLAACSEEFASRSACLGVCEELDDLGSYNSDITSGDHIQCRLYHANSAAEDSLTHCPHAAGAPPCDAE